MNADLAREMFQYDALTGVLYWRKRPVEHFKNQHGCNIFNARYAGKAVGTIDPDGYLMFTYRGRGFKVHRLIWLMETGEWPEGVIDHLDHDKTNNRMSNFRDVTKAANSKNMLRRKNPRTPALGIRITPAGRYSARITADRKGYHIGNFRCLTAAVFARLKAQRTHNFHPNHGRSA
jgi:hypothetical protein